MPTIARHCGDWPVGQLPGSGAPAGRNGHGVTLRIGRIKEYEGSITSNDHLREIAERETD